jgi:hypothetical protein
MRTYRVAFFEAGRVGTAHDAFDGAGVVARIVLLVGDDRTGLEP